MPVEEGPEPWLSVPDWAEYLRDTRPRSVIYIDPGLRDGPAEFPLARLAEDFWTEMSTAVQDAIRIRQAGQVSPGQARQLMGFEPEPRLVRSSLGVSEDPHEWTMPVGDQMHWTAPETDEEVPRWLA